MLGNVTKSKICSDMRIYTWPKFLDIIIDKFPVC